MWKNTEEDHIHLHVVSKVLRRCSIAESLTLPSDCLRAQHRPLPAAAMQYVSSVGAPQLNAQQGKIHLAEHKLIEMQREALWKLYRLSPPMELSSQNCVTLSGFTAPTV